MSLYSYSVLDRLQNEKNVTKMLKPEYKHYLKYDELEHKKEPELALLTMTRIIQNAMQYSYQVPEVRTISKVLTYPGKNNTMTINFDIRNKRVLLSEVNTEDCTPIVLDDLHNAIHLMNGSYKLIPNLTGSVDSLECGICFEDKSELYVCPHCHAKFCFDCIAQHVDASEDINCPGVGCSGKLELTSLLSAFGTKILEYISKKIYVKTNFEDTNISFIDSTDLDMFIKDVITYVKSMAALSCSLNEFITIFNRLGSTTYIKLFTTFRQKVLNMNVEENIPLNDNSPYKHACDNKLNESIQRLNLFKNNSRFNPEDIKDEHMFLLLIDCDTNDRLKKETDMDRVTLVPVFHILTLIDDINNFINNQNNTNKKFDDLFGSTAIVSANTIQETIKNKHPNKFTELELHAVHFLDSAFMTFEKQLTEYNNDRKEFNRSFTDYLHKKNEKVYKRNAETLLSTIMSTLDLIMYQENYMLSINMLKYIASHFDTLLKILGITYDNIAACICINDKYSHITATIINDIIDMHYAIPLMALYNQNEFISFNFDPLARLYISEFSNANSIIKCKCMHKDCSGYCNCKNICMMCNWITCPNCNIAYDPELGQHTCNNDDVETYKMILKGTVQCPWCFNRINKLNGCDVMFCNNCHHEFNYKSGEKITQNMHNPEMEDFNRRRGMFSRHAYDLDPDVLCSSLSPLNVINSITNMHFKLTPHTNEIFKKFTNNSLTSAIRLWLKLYNIFIDTHVVNSFMDDVRQNQIEIVGEQLYGIKPPSKRNRRYGDDEEHNDNILNSTAIRTIKDALGSTYDIMHYDSPVPDDATEVSIKIIKIQDTIKYLKNIEHSINTRAEQFYKMLKPVMIACIKSENKTLKLTDGLAMCLIGFMELFDSFMNTYFIRKESNEPKRQPRFPRRQNGQQNLHI